MFLLKLISSTIIIFSSSLIGYSYSTRYSCRLKNLVSLQNCIKLLETEILYTATPLPEALENTYHKGNKNISFIFKVIKDYLIQNRNKNIVDSFYHVTDVLREKLYLNNEDIEVFLTLGRSLGVSDRTDQEKHFKLVMTQLRAQENDAKEQKSKNEKMYKSLGVLLGLAIVIILF